MGRGKAIKGRWIYSIPKAVYVDLHGSEPVGDAYPTLKEAKASCIGKIFKYVPETKARTYDGGPVIKHDEEPPSHHHDE